MNDTERHNFITARGSIVRVNAMTTPHSKIHVTLAGLAIAVAMFLIAHSQVDAQTPGNMREMMQSMMGDVPRYRPQTSARSLFAWRALVNALLQPVS